MTQNDCKIKDEKRCTMKQNDVLQQIEQNYDEIGFTCDDCIAVRKGDTRMLNLINKALKNTLENGDFKRISEQWFGYDVSAGIRQ